MFTTLGDAALRVLAGLDAKRLGKRERDDSGRLGGDFAASLTPERFPAMGIGDRLSFATRRSGVCLSAKLSPEVHDACGSKLNKERFSRRAPSSAFPPVPNAAGLPLQRTSPKLRN